MRILYRIVTDFTTIYLHQSIINGFGHGPSVLVPVRAIYVLGLMEVILGLRSGVDKIYRQVAPINEYCGGLLSGPERERS